MSERTNADFEPASDLEVSAKPVPDPGSGAAVPPKIVALVARDVKLRGGTSTAQGGRSWIVKLGLIGTVINSGTLIFAQARATTITNYPTDNLSITIFYTKKQEVWLRVQRTDGGTVPANKFDFQLLIVNPES